MPPPGTRLIGMNPNGTSRWAGVDGVEVDVDHNHPLMGDYAQELARVQAAPAPAGVAPQARYADNTTPQQLVNQWTRPQATNALDVGAWNDAPQSPDPELDRRVAQARAQDIGPTLSAPGTSPAALPAAGNTANAHVANARPSPQPVNWNSGAQGQPQGGVGSAGVFVDGRGGSPRRTSMQVAGVSRTEQSGDTPIPGQLDRIQDNAELAAAAELRKGKIEQEAQAQAERTLQGRNERLNRMYNDSVAADAARTQRVDNTRRSFEDIAARARSMTVDPDRRSGGDRVLGAIASFLGGIGSALTGGPNQALQVVEHAIDRDVEAQRANVQHAQHGVSSAQTAYQLAREQGASEQDAERIHMAYEYQRAANEAQRLAAMTGSDVARSNATIAATRWLNTADELLANVNHLQSGHTSETVQTRPVTTGGGGPTRQYFYRNRLTGETRMATAAEVRGVREDLGISGERSEERLAEQGYFVGPPPGASQALDSGDANRAVAFGERMAGFDAALSALRELESLQRSGAWGTGPIGGVVPGRGVTAAAERARHLQQEVYNQINVALNGRRATDQDVARIQNAYGEFTGRGNIIGGADDSDITIQNIRDAYGRLTQARDTLIASQNPSVVQHVQGRLPDESVSDSTFTRGE